MNFLSKLKHCYQYQLRKERWFLIFSDFGELCKMFGLGVLALIGIALFFPYRLLTQFLQPLWIAYIINDDQLTKLKKILFDNSPAGKAELTRQQEQKKQDLMKRLNGEVLDEDD